MRGYALYHSDGCGEPEGITGMKKLLMILSLGLLLILPVRAETPAREIRTPQELAAIAENPSESYVLMEDLDMTGVDWTPFDFSGCLDGNGHSILNLTVNTLSADTSEVLDGNVKPYQARFAGLFGRLLGGEVKHLGLVGLVVAAETDDPVFLGGIAGYTDGGTVSDCTVTGMLELHAWKDMFGVAGVLGYGTGSVENCRVDVTLICTDTGESKDEQFLGGVFATGFLSVTDTAVEIDGYISETGYVHSGGIGGMLLQYPIGMGRFADISGNTVSGRIRFYENNPDRRAYCADTVGELVEAFNFNYKLENNQSDFLRDETKDYSVELQPETCAEPVYRQTVAEPDCENFGYTEHTCTGCGYTYRDQYRLHAHTVTQWQVKTAATETSPGESVGVCDRCGAEVIREDPPVPPTQPEPTTQATVQPPRESESTPPPADNSSCPAAWGIAAAILALTAAGIIVAGKIKKKA